MPNDKPLIFEKHPKKTIGLVIITGIFSALFIFEKYMESVIQHTRVDETRRYIQLREHGPEGIAYLESNLEMIPHCSDTLTPHQARFAVDDNGFIVSRETVRKDNPDLSIIFLGGSTTECRMMEESARFPEEVSRLLQERGLSTNTYNAGRSGNHTLHSIDLLINKGFALNPDIAVMMHNINDLNWLLYEKTYWNQNRHRSLIMERRPTSFFTVVRELKNYLFPNLYLSIKSIARRFTNDDPTDEFWHTRGRPIIYDKEEITTQFKLNLETFIAVCKVRGIVPVLMTQANRLAERPNDLCVNEMLQRMLRGNDDAGITYEDYRDMYLNFNQVIRQTGQENNVLVIDLANQVTPKPQYLYDVVHFTSLGSRFVAQRIVEALAPKGLLNNKN